MATTPRDNTFNASLGFAKLRWGDSPKDVVTAYPHAIRALSLRGKEPQTGEPIYLPPTYIIEHILDLPPLSLVGHVIFHEDNVVGIDLFPRNTYAHGTLPPYIKVALEDIGSRLGIHIEAPGSMLQSWKANDATITLYFQRSDFMLCIYAPGTDATHYDTEAHRGYRRAQSQRCIAIQPLAPELWNKTKLEGNESKSADQIDTSPNTQHKSKP